MEAIANGVAGQPSEIEVLGAREALYHLLAQLFFRPLTLQQLDVLGRIDWKQLSEQKDAANADACNDIYRALRRRNTGTLDELAADYTAVFYGTVTHEGKTAQPFASLFTYNGGQIMGQARGNAYQAFKAAHMRVTEGLDVPDDHLSFLLEFMAQLCQGAIKDLENGGTADRAFAEQRNFFESNIAPWIGAFIELASSTVSTRFYRGVLKLTQSFLSCEAELLGVRV